MSRGGWHGWDDRRSQASFGYMHQLSIRASSNDVMTTSWTLHRPYNFVINYFCSSTSYPRCKGFSEVSMRRERHATLNRYLAPFRANFPDFLFICHHTTSFSIPLKETKHSNNGKDAPAVRPRDDDRALPCFSCAGAIGGRGKSRRALGSARAGTSASSSLTWHELLEFSSARIESRHYLLTRDRS
jgi:hypothetical protein